MLEPRRLTTLWAFMACYRDSFIFFFTNLFREITLPFCVREVPGSNLGRHTDYLDWGFPQIIQANAGVVPPIRLRQIPSMFIPIHNSLMILPLGTTQVELMAASSNKRVPSIFKAEDSRWREHIWPKYRYGSTTLHTPEDPILQVDLYVLTLYEERIITYNTRLRFQTCFKVSTSFMHPVTIKRSLIQDSSAVSNRRIKPT
jgi:hypothetical protein